MSKNARFGLLCFMVAALVLAPGCMSTRRPGTQMDDAAITTAVKSKITADPDLNPFEISVDTNEGVVTLSGAVEEPADREKAVQVARNTDGVRRVINDITIGDPTVGDVLDDKMITASIKTKLAASGDLNPFNIDVDTNQGVVTLSGRVKDSAARQTAEQIARDQSGVKQVQNRISVGEM